MIPKNLKISPTAIVRVLLLLAVSSYVGACRKSEYNLVPGAAYLRVFNTLNYEIDISTKGKPVPFLIMVVDPAYDAQGTLIGGAVIGDFLDVRARYAPPTADAASTDYRNREFPGNLKVPVAPVINGFDLSGWAQVPSGTHRFVFYTRPLSPIPFFDLPSDIRQDQTLIADTTLSLTQSEVYTLNLLEKDARTAALSTHLYLRQEQFHKMAFADSLMYVNFYNLSAEGYAETHPEGSVSINTSYDRATGTAIKDEVNIYYSLLRDDIPFPFTMVNNTRPRIGNRPLPGYHRIPLQRLDRSHTPVAAPYASIPLILADDTTGGIRAAHWIRLDVIPPGGGFLSSYGDRMLSPASGTVLSLTNLSDEGRTQLYTAGTATAPGFFLPSLIRQVASGPYPQRSFGTVSTIEFVNKQIYMTSVMKTYPPPAN